MIGCRILLIHDFHEYIVRQVGLGMEDHPNNKGRVFDLRKEKRGQKKEKLRIADVIIVDSRHPSRRRPSLPAKLLSS